MQLSGTILKGQHDTLIGSELLFMESKAVEEDQNRSKRHLAYVGMTSQRLRFKEVQLRSKQASHSQGSLDGQAESGGKQPDLNSMEIDDMGSEKAEPAIAGKKKRGRRTKGEREKEADKDYPERPGGKGRKNKKKVAEEGEDGEVVEVEGEPRRSTRITGRRKQVADGSHDHQASDGEA
ncbi:hypothetical protein PQX77_018018 [Marasmius sp. AFHP31]|nr:hypothetical protein PQX77_018018 [Marasmius sp. AFHP31]